VPLDDVGRYEARRAARLLATLPPSLLVSSDLARATATAQELADLTGLPLRTDQDLRETFAGSWQGRLAAEIDARDGAAYRAWRRGGQVRPGGGETRSEVADRAEGAIARWFADLPADGVLVATTHGGTARALIGRLLGLPLGSWHVLGGLATCSWSVLEQDDESGWRLTEHNAGTLPEPVVGTDDA
jgi:glucosyl-3-phosphoglycerate phosphatase